MTKKVAQILPLLRLARNLHYFDYTIPDKFSHLIKRGQLVEVPFRNNIIKGVVLDLVAGSKFESKKLKSINKIVDPRPLLANWQLELMRDLAEYYFVSMAVFAKMFIPEIPKKSKLSQEFFLKNINFLHRPKTDLKIDQYYEAKKPVLLRYFKYENKIKIYLALIDRVLKQNKQVLIITPVLADLKRIYQYLGDHKNELSVFLNNLPKNKYWQEWQRIQKGEAKIIMGTRSAIFAPFNNLDLIIIDEEDNENHKQEEPNPRYNVKDVALRLKEIIASKIIFTSLTPSINSLYKAEKKEWQYFEIDKINEKPEIKIVDRREEFKKNNYSIFSEKLLTKIEYNLKRAKKIFLFLNRKGLATLISCKDCGYFAACPNCYLPLTYYKTKELICHHCGYKEELFLFCPKCQGPNIKLTGTGTEKVEIEIKKLFPQAKVIKIDIDTSYQGDLKDIDIIIGTQYALDFIDWQNINLIGVINADILFYLPDYKGMEKTFNLLSKLALFLSDGKKELLIQTFSPQNYIFEAIKNFDAKKFYLNELEERKTLNYPPISKLIKLIFHGFEFKSGQQEVKKIYKILYEKVAQNKNIIINPPLLVYTQQVRGKFRWQIILKLLFGKINLEFLKQLPENIIIDRDPESLL